MLPGLHGKQDEERHHQTEEREKKQIQGTDYDEDSDFY